MPIRSSSPATARRYRPTLPALVLLGALPLTVLAQPQPDAGRLLQEQERERPSVIAPRAVPAPVVDEPVRPALRAPDTLRFVLKGVRFTRATAFPEPELQAVVADLVGKEVGFAELQQAAERITRHYRERGWFVARAYLPAQDIRDGIVEILVLEGRIEKISVNATGDVRLDPAVVRRLLDASLSPQGDLREADLERALMLANDLPGVQVTSRLAPGAGVGGAELAVDVAEGPLLAGNVDLDNAGNKFTGAWRLGAGLQLNDATGLGDQLSLRASQSRGNAYQRLAWSVPVGGHGVKVGASYAATRYRLCCEFAALDATGDASVLGAGLSWPLVRSRDLNLNLSLNHERKQFYNRTVTGTSSDKESRVLVAGLAADGRDGAFGGGINSGSLSLADGRLDLDGWAADRTADATTAQSHGAWRKLGWSAARLQALAPGWTLYGALSGQFASKNLDSSEKFSLGGPQAIRAYPQGEANGDEGWLANLELRREVLPGLTLAAFVDAGGIRLHRNEWAGWQGGNARLANRYRLAGGGLGLAWSLPGELTVRASLAHRFGSNPGRDANDNDADATRDRTRLWLNAVTYF